MRNKNNNRRGVLNTANPDWNEDRGAYGRGYQDHGYENERGRYYGNQGNLGYGTSIGGRYDNYGADRYYNERGGYTENQFSRDSGFNRGLNRRSDDEGYNTYDHWRTSGAGNDYGRDYLNYGSERGANDRSWDEYNRGDYERRDYRGSNFGGGSYGSDYNRNRRGYDRDERDWWDKTSDEVSSWFGDEDAERRREWDKQRSGQHKGKGPRGYNRSDDRIKEDINDRLSDDVFVDATDIEVNVNQGEVILTGTVDQRSAKRRAEDIAEGVSGVRNVENRLRVVISQGTSDRAWSSSSMGGNTSPQTSTGEKVTSSERTSSKLTV